MPGPSMHRIAPHRIIPLSWGGLSLPLLPSIFFSSLLVCFCQTAEAHMSAWQFNCLEDKIPWQAGRMAVMPAVMDELETDGRENEWLNAKVDPSTCPAGAGMSGMGPLHKTMVSLGTRRSNPPGDQDFGARTTLSTGRYTYYLKC